jgi:hypothetical protein
MVKQLKNRYNDPTLYKRFMIGIDRAKMRLYDLEDIAQSNLADSGQEETENTNFGMSKLLKTKDFSGIKV